MRHSIGAPLGAGNASESRVPLDFWVRQEVRIDGVPRLVRTLAIILVLLAGQACREPEPAWLGPPTVVGVIASLERPDEFRVHVTLKDRRRITVRVRDLRRPSAELAPGRLFLAGPDGQWYFVADGTESRYFFLSDGGAFDPPFLRLTSRRLILPIGEGFDKSDGRWQPGSLFYLNAKGEVIGRHGQARTP